MSFTFSSFQALLIPLIAIFGFIGWRRGFWRQVGVTAGLALVVLATVMFPDRFIGFINRVITNFPRVIAVLLGAEGGQRLPEDLLFGDVTSARYLLARFALFVLLVFLVYTTRFGWAYADGKPRFARTTGEQVLGAILGGVAGFLWFVALNDFLNGLRRFRQDPLIPPEGTTITIPAVQDVTPLLDFVPTITVILIIIIVVLAALRLPRLWNDGKK